MSLQRFMGVTPNSPRILHGNDTDASYLTIVRFGLTFVVTSTMIDEENAKAVSTVRDLSYSEFKEEFMSQLGTPMQYMNEGDIQFIMNVKLFEKHENT